MQPLPEHAYDKLLPFFSPNTGPLANPNYSNVLCEFSPPYSLIQRNERKGYAQLNNSQYCSQVLTDSD